MGLGSSDCPVKLGNSCKIVIFEVLNPNSMAEKNRIILTVINDLTGDQRIHRIASTLQGAGYQVTVVGRILPDSLPLENRSYQTHRMRLLFRKGKWFYLEYNIRLFFLLLIRPAEIVNANDLDTLLAAYLATRLKGTELVYDSHEYFTEVPELIHRKWTRSMWLRLERWLFPKLAKVYTVNGSIAAIYQEKYGVPVEVIRNLPFRRKKAKKGPPAEKILLYQGALNVGRGIELMIDVMHHLPNCRLWIIGKGDLDTQLRKRARQAQLIDRVTFLGFVPMEQLYEITVQAELGLSLEEDLGESYRYSSPNKVHDYIQAGVPVLISDLPEMRSLIETHAVGEILAGRDRSPERLAIRIQEMLESAENYRQWQKNCREAAKVLNWEAEQANLLRIYARK